MVRLVAFPDEGIAVLQTRGYRFFPLTKSIDWKWVFLVSLFSPFGPFTVFYLVQLVHMAILAIVF